MKMNLESLADKAGWQAAGVTLPQFNVQNVIEATEKAPVWLHFGAGNIFRGFIAVLQQRLLNEGLAQSGIIAADTFDYDIIDEIYAPYNNLTMNVTLNPDATIGCEVIASVTGALRANSADEEQMQQLNAVFESPSLQMVSFTITEKGYALRGADGTLLKVVQEDIENGPQKARHAMSMVAAGLYKRYLAGGQPVAMVSMDNCSHNGEKLAAAVTEIAEKWCAKGLVEEGFLGYLNNEDKVAFPWSMIDKITPRPDKTVEEMLLEKGIENMSPITTKMHTYIAPFVNAERPQYLVVEDKFPNGRPPLEKAGVYMTDRETVNKTERMKVTTCLNPLHTAMSVYGCLLGYTLIYKEMQDAQITALIKRLGYVEGLPVVTDPGILSPKAFIDEVVNERLPNPFMPDDPRRIATDTSQKVGIRFGETIKSYIEQGRNIDELVSVPLAIAGWMRYLLGVDDEGREIEVSPDPLKDELQKQLDGIVWNSPQSYSGQLKPILANANIFGTDLTKTSLAERIEKYFVEELEGAGSVRATLKKHLS